MTRHTLNRKGNSPQDIAKQRPPAGIGPSLHDGRNAASVQAMDLFLLRNLLKDRPECLTILSRLDRAQEELVRVLEEAARAQGIES